MEKKENDKIFAFDSLFTTNRIQMFKIILSYLPRAAQKDLAVYIKFMELQYTIQFFKTHPYAALDKLSLDGKPDTTQLCDDIIPFCDASQQNMISQFKQTMQTFQSIQDMMAMMDMMKDLFPEGFGGEGANMQDMTEIMNLFNTFQTMNSSDN